MGAHLDADLPVRPAVHLSATAAARTVICPAKARPNIAHHRRGRLHEGLDIGAHRFPTSAQNPYLKFDSFAYPAAFTAGTLGRNTFEGPGLNWTQLSLAKWWQFGERARFQLRVDGNNFFRTKQPNYSNPSAPTTPRARRFRPRLRHPRLVLRRRHVEFAPAARGPVPVLIHDLISVSEGRPARLSGRRRGAPSPQAPR